MFLEQFQAGTEQYRVKDDVHWVHPTNDFWIFVKRHLFSQSEIVKSLGPLSLSNFMANFCLNILTWANWQTK